MSDDILRGLRWGAILLAGLAIGVACYRLMQESPPKEAQESPPKVAQETESTSPPHKGSGAANKLSERPAPSTNGSRTVPAPPANRQR
jgi:hypothetical protein